MQHKQHNTKRGHVHKEQYPDILLKQQICSEVLFSFSSVKSHVQRKMM